MYSEIRSDTWVSSQAGRDTERERVVAFLFDFEKEFLLLRMHYRIWKNKITKYFHLMFFDQRLCLLSLILHLQSHLISSLFIFLKYNSPKKISFLCFFYPTWAWIQFKAKTKNKTQFWRKLFLLKVNFSKRFYLQQKEKGK